MRARWGSGPVALLAGVASLAIAAWVATQIADLRAPLNVVAWFAGAIVVHDLVLFPVYSLAGRIALRLPRRALNHVRVPAVLSLLLLIVWFPLVLGLTPEGNYVRVAGEQPPDYLLRWLLFTAALFAGSGLLYLLRGGRRPCAAAPPRPE
jgi:hypothetical protein